MPSTSPSPAELNERFEVPGVLRFEAGRGGLTLAAINAPSAEATVYLHGAHVTHYRPAGQQPVLWLSAHSLFEPAKAIRGGVPVIFPWFGPRAGDPSAPMHGFARTREWAVAAARQLPDESVSLTLSLAADDATRALWPHAFEVLYHVRVAEVLELSLEVRNASDQPFEFEEALHSYFAVGDVRQASVSGLAGSTYVDKTDQMVRKPQGPEPITITAETDRVYLKTRATCVIDDPPMNRRIQIAKENSDATVVWNPWVAKAKAMADFGDDEWTGMLCVETVNAAEHRVTLAGGASHTMKAAIHCGRR